MHTRVRSGTDSRLVSPRQVADTGRILVALEDWRGRSGIVRLANSLGFEADAADDAAHAVQLLRARRYALIICDVPPAAVQGPSLLDQSAALAPNLPFLLVDSARQDVHTLPSPAPISSACHDSLTRAIVAVCRLQKSAVQHRAGVEPRAPSLVQRDVDLREERESVWMLSVRITESLVNAMELKDQYLRGHSQRVAALAAAIGEEVGLQADTVEAVRLAGRLHDVGKIGIREEILNKPGALTVEEFEHIKQHVRIGMEILAPLEHLGVVLDFVHDHHEHWDGTGYPRGLVGEHISLGGRILTAADAFDALTSKRAYREPLTPQETLAHLGKNGIGSLLDPHVFDALASVVRRNKLLQFIDENVD